MSEAEVITIVREYLAGLFPKSCPTCQRCFVTLEEYLLATNSLGPVMAYDADMGNWKPLKPIGTMFYANCPCGNTVVLSTGDMQLSQYHALLTWAWNATRTRNVTPQELFGSVREEIYRAVVSAEAFGLTRTGTRAEAAPLPAAEETMTNPRLF